MSTLMFHSLAKVLMHVCSLNTLARLYVRKYRKSYCSHPSVGIGVSVSVGVALMLKCLVSVSLEHVDGLS